MQQFNAIDWIWIPTPEALVGMLLIAGNQEASAWSPVYGFLGSGIRVTPSFLDAPVVGVKASTESTEYFLQLLGSFEASKLGRARKSQRHDMLPGQTHYKRMEAGSGSNWYQWDISFKMHNAYATLHMLAQSWYLSIEPWLTNFGELMRVTWRSCAWTCNARRWGGRSRGDQWSWSKKEKDKEKEEKENTGATRRATGATRCWRGRWQELLACSRQLYQLGWAAQGRGVGWYHVPLRPCSLWHEPGGDDGKL